MHGDHTCTAAIFLEGNKVKLMVGLTMKSSQHSKGQVLRRWMILMKRFNLLWWYLIKRKRGRTMFSGCQRLLLKIRIVFDKTIAWSEVTFSQYL